MRRVCSAIRCCRLRALPKLFGLRARRIKGVRALLHVIRALRILLLQFAGLPLSRNLAPQRVTRRLRFRDGSGRYRGGGGERPCVRAAEQDSVPRPR